MDARLFPANLVLNREQLTNILSDHNTVSKLNPSNIENLLSRLMQNDDSNTAYKMLQDIIRQSYFDTMIKSGPDAGMIATGDRLVELDSVLKRLFGLNGLLSYATIMGVYHGRENLLEKSFISVQAVKLLMEEHGDKETVRTHLKHINDYFVDMNTPWSLLTYNEEQQPCMILNPLANWLQTALASVSNLSDYQGLTDAAVLEKTGVKAEELLKQLDHANELCRLPLQLG